MSAAARFWANGAGPRDDRERQLMLAAMFEAKAAYGLRLDTIASGRGDVVYAPDGSTVVAIWMESRWMLTFLVSGNKIVDSRRRFMCFSN